MSVVTVWDEPPPLLPHREWTVDDLANLPDDGLRYELFDGVLVVSPSPYPIHQRAVMELSYLLRRNCPPGLEVFVAPLDFQPTTKRSLQPDILVVRRGAVDDWSPLRVAPVLTVEVLSDSTASMDHIFKRALYAQSGVAHFWIFDPRVPSFVAHELRNGEYHEVASAKRDQVAEVTAPYPVSICPAEIIKG
jgi:Uma2 family endonuclease